MHHTNAMRTSVDISDRLYLQVRKTALDRGTSMKRLMEEGLRRVLLEYSADSGASAAFSLPVLKGGKPRKGVDLTDTSRLLEKD